MKKFMKKHRKDRLRERASVSADRFAARQAPQFYEAAVRGAFPTFSDLHVETGLAQVQRKASIYRVVSHAFPYGRLIDVEKPTPTLVAALIVCKTTSGLGARTCTRVRACVPPFAALTTPDRHRRTSTRGSQPQRPISIRPKESSRRRKVNRLLSHQYPAHKIQFPRPAKIDAGLIRPLIRPLASLLNQNTRLGLTSDLTFDKRNVVAAAAATQTCVIPHRIYSPPLSPLLAFFPILARNHKGTKGHRPTVETRSANAAR
jgi:hypothetical protein